jgi:hypothetical protein
MTPQKVLYHFAENVQKNKMTAMMTEALAATSAILVKWKFKRGQIWTPKQREMSLFLADSPIS